MNATGFASTRVGIVERRARFAGLNSLATRSLTEHAATCRKSVVDCAPSSPRTPRVQFGDQEELSKPRPCWTTPCDEKISTDRESMLMDERLNIAALNKASAGSEQIQVLQVQENSVQNKASVQIVERASQKPLPASEAESALSAAFAGELSLSPLAVRLSSAGN